MALRTDRPIRGGSRLTPAFLLATVAIVVVLVAVWWSQRDDGTTPVTDATLGAISADPDRFTGQQVTVLGEVESSHNERLLTLRDSDVVVLAPAATDVDVGDTIEVTGEVARVTRTEVAAEIGAAAASELPDAIADQQTVVRAASVRLSPGLTQPTPDPALRGEGIMPVATLVEEQDSHMGQDVRVSGEMTAQVIPHVATVESPEGEERILVITREPSQGTFLARTTVRVDGRLVALDVEAAEQELGIDLDAALLDEYEGDPAIIATDMHYFASGPGSGEELLGLVDQRATVAGTVEVVHGSRVVLLEARNILVVVPEGMEVPAEGDGVQATGIVRVSSDETLGALGDLPADEREALRRLPMLEVEEIAMVE